MTSIDTTAPDLAAVKQRQQAAWASGDFAVVAARIVLVAEHLCDTADLHAGWRVLDVATGSGNAAIAAARHGCEVVGVDYVPALLDVRPRARRGRRPRGRLRRGRRRGAAVPGRLLRRRHVRVRLDVRARPRAGGRRAAPRLPARRHDRPRQLDARRLHRRALPHGRRARAAAGRRAVADALGHRGASARAFGDGIASLEVEERTFTFRFASAEEFVDFFRTWYGPTLKAFAALDEAARDALEDDLIALARRSDRLGGVGATAIPATYIEAVAVTR